MISYLFLLCFGDGRSAGLLGIPLTCSPFCLVQNIIKLCYGTLHFFSVPFSFYDFNEVQVYLKRFFFGGRWTWLFWKFGRSSYFRLLLKMGNFPSDFKREGALFDWDGMMDSRRSYSF
jgi:hypothetical protein